MKIEIQFDFHYKQLLLGLGFDTNKDVFSGKKEYTLLIGILLFSIAISLSKKNS